MSQELVAPRPERKWGRLVGRSVATIVLAISFFGVLLLWTLSILTVSKFEKIFAQFGAPLPAATGWVISLTHLLQQHWFLSLALIVLVHAALAAWIWFGRWGWGLAISLLIIILSLAYVPFAALALFQPLVGITQAARAQGTGRP